jgi:hypothetical protein
MTNEERDEIRRPRCPYWSARVRLLLTPEEHQRRRGRIGNLLLLWAGLQGWTRRQVRIRAILHLGHCAHRSSDGFDAARSAMIA